MLGVIGGSGLDRFEGLEITGRRAVDTPYGAPSAALTFGTLRGREIVFLPRHGEDHSVAPHRINYRANLWALHAHGVSELVAVCAVGGISARMATGLLVVPDQIIDYTYGREATYYDGVANPLQHVDFTMPFSALLRRRLLVAGDAARQRLHDGGTYGATQGPRLETAAEINRMERDGADIVGMTGMPEAVLARELGIDYAMLAVVVNAAAGRGDSAREIPMTEIQAVADAGMRQVRQVILTMAGADGG